MFLFQWLLVLSVRLVLIVTGLVVVPVALPFRDWGSSVSDGRPITVLPQWAWIWSNDFDGTLGDKRGWWDKNAPFGLGAAHLFSQFWWLAVRNPANNFRRTRLGSCPVKDCFIHFKGNFKVSDKPGMGGWRFTKAIHRQTGQKWFGFYLVHQWNGTRAFVVRIGYKIEPWHELSNEPPKGFTFKINPWKAI